MDIIQHFNNNVRDQWLNKKITNGHHKGLTGYQKIQTLLPKTIKHLLLEIKETNNNITDTYYRMIGYDGIGSGTGGINSLLKSKEAKDLNNKKTNTKDHLLGASEIGRQLQLALEIEYNKITNKNLYNDLIIQKDYLESEETKQLIQHITQNWIYNNLWMWMSIEVSSKEHSSKNIIRNSHNIKQKIKLEHYINVSKIEY